MSEEINETSLEKAIHEKATEKYMDEVQALQISLKNSPLSEAIFKMKTGDEERIYFDPYTMRIHLQNDLWIDEFNSDLLLGMIDDLEFLISNYNLRVAENIKEKWGFDHD